MNRGENGLRRRAAPDGLTGGARQLAQVLEKRVKDDPNRFVHLGLRFPVDANPVYLQRTLHALEDTTVASNLKLQLCRKAFAEARSSCGRAIADVLGKVEDALPDDGVGMLDWLATRDDDPAVERWKQAVGDGQRHHNGDIHFHGINTTRGRAAGAIGGLILRNATYIGRFRTTLDKMVRDPSAAVLSCVAGTLRAVAHHDTSLGMSLFQGMDLSDDRLLATRNVYEFIRSCLHDRLVEWRPIIERMLRSSEPEVREAGARLGCIAALHHESAAALANEALRADVRGRLGAAGVASANVGDPECRVLCEPMLVRLFQDVDAEVRCKAALCFGNLPNEVMEDYGTLIAAFCDSPAFEEAAFWLLRALEHSRERLPGTTCVVCKKYLGRMGDTDSHTGQFTAAHTIVKLIFRTYQQHQKDEWTKPSLDLIDLVCLEGIADAGNEMEKFER